MGDIEIGGIGLGVIILFLVQLLKKIGLPDGYGGYAVAVLSVLGYALLQVTQLFPATLPGIVGVLQVLAFIATTFGSAVLSFAGVRKAQIKGF